MENFLFWFCGAAMVLGGVMTVVPLVMAGRLVPLTVSGCTTKVDAGRSPFTHRSPT